ncbi:MAG: CPBP family intramembrane glutamic endopeptidase, partial [Terriglobales bacterium]
FNAVYRPLALALMLLLFIPMARFLSHDPRSPLETQALDFAPRWRRDLLLGSILGTAMIVLGVIAIAALGAYHPELLPREGMAVRLLTVLWMGFTAAALEEVAFRGYPFQTLIHAIGPGGATLMFCLLFGAIHLANPHANAFGFTNTALVSFLLALAYLRTGYLWLPIGIHFAWNVALGTVFGLPVSGISEFAVVVKARAEGSPLLTGGDYGLEASLTGTAVILVGIGVVYLLTPAKKDVTNGNAPDVLSL